MKMIGECNCSQMGLDQVDGIRLVGGLAGQHTKRMLFNGEHEANGHYAFLMPVGVLRR